MHSENKPQTVARYMLLANCRNIGDDTQKVSTKSLQALSSNCSY